MIIEHNGSPHWYDESFLTEKLADLRSRSDNLSAYEADELQALGIAEQRMTKLRTAASRSGHGEKIDNNLAGFGQPVPRGTMSAPLTRSRSPWDGEIDRADAKELRSRALTAVEQIHRMPDAARETSAQMLQADDDPLGRTARYVIASSDPHYYAAFCRWVNDPVGGSHEWSPEERNAVRRVTSESRSLALGASGGGFLVPYELDPAVVLSNTGSVNPMRQLARVEKTAQNEKRFVTSLGVTASWDAESAEVSDDTPTLLQPAITAYKGNAFVPISWELAEDSDISRQVGALFADAKTQLEATAFITGAGGTLPRGIITAVAAAAGSVILDAAGTALTVANAVTAQNALPARWRANASWLANLSIINQGRVLPLFASGPALVSDSVPPRMLGWNLYEASQMDGTIAAGATNDYCLLCGDFRNYVIVDRLGATLQLYPGLVGANRRPTGEVGWQLHWRAGADLLVSDSMRLTNWSG